MNISKKERDGHWYVPGKTNVEKQDSVVVLPQEDTQINTSDTQKPNTNVGKVPKKTTKKVTKQQNLKKHQFSSHFKKINLFYLLIAFLDYKNFQKTCNEIDQIN